jgi:triacylglycerol lipase
MKAIRYGLFLVGLLGLALPAAASARPGRAAEPVVVIGGLSGTCSSTAGGSLAGGVQKGLAVARVQSGYTVDAVPTDRVYPYSYNPCNTTLAKLAKQFDTYLAGKQAANGGVPLDVVSFSFGGAITRYCLTNAGGNTPGCAARLDDWVGLVNSTHGSTTANASMCAAAALIGQWSVCTMLIPGSPELRAMAKGDESPGSVEYSSLWAAQDELIFPAGSQRLDGALNVKLTSSKGSVGHATAWSGGPCTTTQDWVGALLLDLIPSTPSDLTLDCTSPLPEVK